MIRTRRRAATLSGPYTEKRTRNSWAPAPNGTPGRSPSRPGRAFAAELLEVLARHLDLRTHGDLAHAAAREVGVERRLHPLDRRKCVDLDRDGIGDEEVAVRVFVDQPAVLRVQRLRGHLDVVQAQAEGEHELPEGRRPDAPSAQGLQGPPARVIDPGQAARRDLLSVPRLRELEGLEPQDPEMHQPP